MGNSKRSVRRHHRERLMKKRSHHYGYGTTRDRMPDEIRSVHARTSTTCSCWMCGNPRKFFGFVTRAESVSRLDEDEQREENDLSRCHQVIKSNER